ncbi:MAG: hypothetical protein M4579_000221 [Chaenotheca gracillima]|nr:MAG: hypothetical protein M4579_000221 [Chaenotheca gracillima]
MVNLGTILFPLYIYPTPGAWQPLLDAASAHPSITFQAVINIYNGPGGDACPNIDYAPAIRSLNAQSNIKTLGYVHTASRYNCGDSGIAICPATQTQKAIQANITTYVNWATKCASVGNPRVDGIFFDEAPTIPESVSYMSQISKFARQHIPGASVVFNPGSPVDAGYWPLADLINVFEDTEQVYRTADIGAVDGQGAYSQKTSLIVHTYTDGNSILSSDVDTILNLDHDAIAALFVTDLTVAQNPYGSFGSNWNAFVRDVATVVAANQA